MNPILMTIAFQKTHQILTAILSRTKNKLQYSIQYCSLFLVRVVYSEIQIWWYLVSEGKVRSESLGGCLSFCMTY